MRGLQLEMRQFFQDAESATDPLYCKVGSASNSHFEKAKQLTERMWACCGQFIDANAVERARKDDFYAAWWELYVAYALALTPLVSLHSARGLRFQPKALCFGFARQYKRKSPSYSNTLRKVRSSLAMPPSLLYRARGYRFASMSSKFQVLFVLFARSAAFS
jgi:hypothetical protein